LNGRIKSPEGTSSSMGTETNGALPNCLKSPEGTSPGMGTETFHPLAEAGKPHLSGRDIPRYGDGN